MTAVELLEWVRDARQRTCDLVADLNDEQLMSPYLPTINPLVWEIGHVAWFQEKWVLRCVCKQKPIRDDADALWDSIAISHKTRWSLPLPSREETLAYMNEVKDRILEQLQRGKLSRDLIYFVRYTIYHEDMHNEAFTYTRQTLGYPPPRFSGSKARTIKPVIDADGRGKLPHGGPLPGDVEGPGGAFMLGAPSEEPFVFDNEKWGHPVEVEPFAIARAPVTQSEFAAFVDDNGYRRSNLWSKEGWDWREAEGAEHPVYWQHNANGSWLRRHFDKWELLEPNFPIIHVNQYEAEAYCRWAKRRLPTEAEWEIAAAIELNLGEPVLSSRKRRFPWGTGPPTPDLANLDWEWMGCIDVGSLAAGHSALGCRQMIGNVWEWTSSTFLPYPGFEIDPYKEYSEPWFKTHKVLRGGCWTTRSRMLRNTWRNFYTPDRRDVLAGFRTCAVK